MNDDNANALGSPEEDASVLAAARRGDSTAIAGLYERYARMIHAILLVRLSPEDTDDGVHDVFLKAIRKLHTLAKTNAVGPYIAAMARNHAVDVHRKHRPALRLSDDIPARPPPPAEALDMLDALRALPEPQADMLAMRLVEGMSGPEIAARTGMSHEAVRVTLHRAVKRLRAQFGAEEGR